MSEFDGPGDDTPAGDPPAGETPAEQAPAKKAPAKKAPAKKAPAKKAPAAEDAPPPARPSGSSPAAAARRARKIGGRPAGVARPEPQPEPEPVPEPQPERASIFTKKTVAPPVPAERAEPTPAAAPTDDADLGEPEARTVVVTAVPAWLNWAPAAVLSIGVLVMAVLLAVFSHGVWWGPDPTQVPKDKTPGYVRVQVLAAAKNCVATTNTYKYTDLDSYETKALACATGEFAGQLRDTIERLIKVNAPKLKSSQTAQINRGGIEAVSSDGKQWTILLFGQLSVTNTENKQPRTDPFAAQVRMERVNGKWLIGALTTVSSPLS